MTEKKENDSKEKVKESDAKEYGVVLKKEKKFRHRIYPQKGRVPEDTEDDSYKVV